MEQVMEHRVTFTGYLTGAVKSNATQVPTNAPKPRHVSIPAKAPDPIDPVVLVGGKMTDCHGRYLFFDSRPSSSHPPLTRRPSAPGLVQICHLIGHGDEI